MKAAVLHAPRQPMTIEEVAIANITLNKCVAGIIRN